MSLLSGSQPFQSLLHWLVLVIELLFIQVSFLELLLCYNASIQASLIALDIDAIVFMNFLVHLSLFVLDITGEDGLNRPIHVLVLKHGQCGYVVQPLFPPVLLLLN